MWTYEHKEWSAEHLLLPCSALANITQPGRRCLKSGQHVAMYFKTSSLVQLGEDIDRPSLLSRQFCLGKVFGIGSQVRDTFR